MDDRLHARTWPGPPGTTPIVLLHALGGSGAHWVGVAPALSALGPVHAIDLAGHGLSSRRHGVSIDRNRELLGEFLEELGPAVVIGSSFGGGVAMLQAAAEPRSIRALVLSGSMLPLEPGPSPRRRLLRRRLRQRAGDVLEVARAIRGGRLGRGHVQEFLLRGNAADPTAVDAATVLEIVTAPRPPSLEGLRTTIVAGRSSFGLVADPARFNGVLDAIACPVLAIHGARDRTVPVAQARAQADRANWTVEILADVGHLPHLESPTRWTRAVADWLQRDGRAAP